MDFKGLLITAKAALATVLGGALSALLPMIQGSSDILFTHVGQVQMAHEFVHGAVVALVFYLIHSPFQSKNLDSQKGQ